MPKKTMKYFEYPQRVVISTEDGSRSGTFLIAVKGATPLVCPVIETGQEDGSIPWKELSHDVQFDSINDFRKALDAWYMNKPRDEDDRIIPFPLDRNQ